MAQKLGLWGPYSFHTPLNVLAINTWSNSDVKPAKTFLASEYSSEFWFILGSKIVQNWTFEAPIIHISESSSNDHIKKLFNKIVENLHFDSFGGLNWLKIWVSGPIVYSPTKVVPTSLWTKFRVHPVETLKKNRRKPIYWTILVLFGAKTARKVGPPGPSFTYTWTYP